MLQGYNSSLKQFKCCLFDTALPDMSITFLRRWCQDSRMCARLRFTRLGCHCNTASKSPTAALVRRTRLACSATNNIMVETKVALRLPQACPCGPQKHWQDVRAAPLPGRRPATQEQEVPTDISCTQTNPLCYGHLSTLNQGDSNEQILKLMNTVQQPQ